MDEEEDSRTSAVGRKRDLGAMQVVSEHEDKALSSGEDSRSLKRVKRIALSQNAAVDFEPLNLHDSSGAMIPHSRDLASIFTNSMEGITPLIHGQALADPSGQQVDQNIARPIWNRSAQTGVRTSFGVRQKSLPKHLEIGKMCESSLVSQPEDVSSLSQPVVDKQPEKVTDVSVHGLDKMSTDSSTNNANTTLKTDHMALENPSSFYEAKESASVGLDTSLSWPPPVNDLPPKNSLEKQSGNAKKTAKPKLPPTGAPVKHKCGGGTLMIPEMFVNNSPVEIDNLRFEDFLVHLTHTNSKVKFSKIRPQHLRVAFAKYIDGYYPPSRVSEAQKSAANATATHNPDMITLLAQSVTKLKTGLGKQALSSQNASLQAAKKTSDKVSGDSQLLHSSQKVQPLQLPVHSGERTPAPGTSHTQSNKAQEMFSFGRKPQDPQQVVHIEAGGRESSAPNQLQANLTALNSSSAAPIIANHNEQLPKTDILMGDSPQQIEESRRSDPFKQISEIENALLGKYFPPVDGVLAKLRCLACAETTHSTIDCPALSCTACGGNHTTFQCRKYQLCNRCRQRGHSSSDCTEKLLPSKDELSCDMCGSKSHIETHCQLIWRSFVAKPEEIKPRLNVPVYCYFCGDNGHYGGECGLNNEVSSSGGDTWSRSARMTVTPTINAPRKKDFSIRGKANDPITLDDSEDDVEFIRAKVNNPPVSRRRDYGPGSGGQVSFDNTARTAAPLIDSYDRVANFRAHPTGPTQSNTGFAFGGGASTERYVGFPPPQMQYPDANGEYSNQRGPPPSLQMAPGKNARGGSSGTAGRGGRGGRGGGGSRGRGGTIASAPARPKKKKKKGPKAGKIA